MGLIISAINSISNRFSAALHTWISPRLLVLEYLNNIDALSANSPIDSRIAEHVYYIDRGRGLLNMANARAWARQAALNQTLDQAVMQVVNLICYTFNWPYAEIWATHPVELYSIYLQRYHVRSSAPANYHSLDFERAVRHLGFASQNMGALALIVEVAGLAYVTETPIWAGTRDVVAFSTPERAALISAAGFKNCFAVPVVKNGVSTHCISFFRREDRKPDKDLMLLVQTILHEIVNQPPPIENVPDGYVSDVSVASDGQSP